MPTRSNSNSARKVSNLATRSELKFSPNVVRPSSYSAPISETLGNHRDHAYADSETSSGDESAASVKDVAADYAFAFDIDGVLLRGGEVIPEAITALEYLNGDNPSGIKVPYIFVTNVCTPLPEFSGQMSVNVDIQGGGKTEQERCMQLSKQLQVSVSPDQFICGHTPMRAMANVHKTILVVGGEGEKCRHVAETYGFSDVVTPGDIMKWKSSVTPFRSLTEQEHRNSRERDFSTVCIDAIFVFADSRHWGDDAQIILELLMSKNGRMGTLSDTFDEGPPLFFSHNDFVWRTDYDLNRLGMGALRCIIEALFKKQTGKELAVTSYGKPQLGTFDYATRVLAQWREEVFGATRAPRTVYFVGDTPESGMH